VTEKKRERDREIYREADIQKFYYVDENENKKTSNRQIERQIIKETRSQLR
jgi:hypothetical protein